MVSDYPAPAVIDIPPVSSETRVWVPQHPEYYSRNELRRQRGEYRSTIPTRIAEWTPRVPVAILADIEDATRALVGFDTYALQVLGKDAPAVAPMSAILLRTESASSSQIENLTVSARQLALAEILQDTGPNARVVLGNVRALEAALALSDRLDQASILRMHKELLSRQSGAEEHAGTWRDQLVWIGRGTAGPREAEFVAPQHEHVPDAIDDLLGFIDRDDLPVLIQTAVAHAQFETIHPFVDGNGRTGRALAQAMLRGKGLVTHTTVPVSAGLLTDLGPYLHALTAYRAGDATPIVTQFAAAARFATVTGQQLVDRLAGELHASRMLLRGVRSQSAAWRVVPALIGQPVVNAHYLNTHLGMSDVTAYRALDVLTARGVLTERTGHRRNRVWQHRGILEALDEYAARVRRG